MGKLIRHLRTASVLFALGIQFPSSAQLSGAYTIGGWGADYSSILPAFLDLQAQGLSGPVELLVNNGTFVESWDLDMAGFAGLSAQNTITLRSASGDSSGVTVEYGTPDVGTALWGFANMRHIRFEDITWKHTAPDGATLFRVDGDMIDVRFTGNAFVAGTSDMDHHISAPHGPVEDVVVERNTFTGDAVSSVVLSTSLGTKDSHNVKVRYNDFNRGQGTVDLGFIVGLAVDSNVFHDAYLAIRLMTCDSITVRWNEIGTVDRAISLFGTNTGGIHACVHVLVEGNRITASGAEVSGIELSYSQHAHVLNNILVGTGDSGINLMRTLYATVSGNMITEASGTGIEWREFEYDTYLQDNTVSMTSANDNLGLFMDTQFQFGSIVHVTGNRFHSVDDGLGMEIGSLVVNTGPRPLVANNEVVGFSQAAFLDAYGSDIVFNSFRCGASATVPMVMYLFSDMQFANNVVSVPAGAPAAFICQIYGQMLNLHHNIYDYDAGSMALSSVHSDLATANADGTELGSLLLDPQFLDPATSLIPGNTAVLNTGIPSASVLTDILGSPRSLTNPTPGAYEGMDQSVTDAFATNADLQVWPDPVEDHVFLAGGPFNGAVEVTVLAIDGRTLLHRTTNAFPVLLNGLDELPCGALVIRCADAHSVRAVRVLKR